MSDAALNFFLASGTNAERLAFTPSPATPAAGPNPTYIWFETDTGDSFAWDFGGSAWGQLNTAGAVANAVTFDNSGAGDASGTTYNGSAAKTISSNTLGLGAADSPQFTAINLGHASDTTLTRVSAGVVAIEGNAIYHAGGTDVPVADGGTGASTAAGAATNLGLGTGDSPQFTAVNIGHASDTTVTRTGAGDLAIEGNAIYRAGGTDVPVADGGTGSSTAAGAATNLGLGTGDSPQFTAVNIGHASDTTITRVSAGVAAVEGNTILTAATGQPLDATLTSLSAITGSLIKPGGRLTLVTGTPVMTSDQTAKGTIYYTPDQTDLITLYDGTDWTFKTFTELTLTLDSTNHPIENLFDAFICNDGGTIKIGTGPAWNYNATVTMTIATPCVVTWTAHGLPEGTPIVFTTSGALPTGITAGTTYYVGRSPATDTFNISTTVANAAAGTFVATSGSQSGTHTGTNHTRARGTGAGTTELERKNGIWTNKNSIALKNGAGAAFATISANQATYVGTFYTTAAGQTGMAFNPAAASGGSNPILGVFNAYNRVRITAASRDSASSWTYTSTTWRASNNSNSDRVSWIDGLGECYADAFLSQIVQQSSSSNQSFIGIDFDSTTATPTIVASSSSTTFASYVTVRKAGAAGIGFRFASGVEKVTAGTGTFYGLVNSEQQQQLSVSLEM